MDSAAKRAAPSKRIGTHDGTFHCDEVTACFLLRQLPEYSDAEIIRTRNPKVLETCDIVVDVGGEFDRSKHRYDHHQRSFEHTFASLCPEKPDWRIKLSSAGLVYLHFGRRVLGLLTGLGAADAGSADTQLLDKLYDKMYENFVMEIDAVDNGVAVADSKLLYAQTTGLSARVSNLNAWWNAPSEENSASAEMARFEQAMALVEREFRDRVHFYQACWWPARRLVDEAMASRRADVRPDGQILVFGSGGCPWKAHLLELEEEAAEKGVVKYVLYPDQNGKWRVQCVPLGDDAPFQNRLTLPEAWRGLRDAALSSALGLDGCIFVHAGGFIGGHEHRDGALAMANMALEVASAVAASNNGRA